MAGERLIELGVETLATYLGTAIPTAITELETEQGLAAGTLKAIEAVVQASLPEDPRSPLLEVYDKRAVPDSGVAHGLTLWRVTCGAALSTTGDADLEASEIRSRRYATAIIRALKADPTLGGKVYNLRIDEYAIDAAQRGEDIRYTFEFTITFDVVDEP